MKTRINNLNCFLCVVVLTILGSGSSKKNAEEHAYE
jgi:hypothetical protein